MITMLSSMLVTGALQVVVLLAIEKLKIMLKLIEEWRIIG
jgi:hypothetical protein